MPPSPAPPFAHLNLVRNPFGEVCLDALQDLALIATDKYLDHLSASKRCLQFVGEKGRGKTTHLRSLHAHFPEAPYQHFNDETRAPIPAGKLLFLDEFQRLQWWQRRRCYRQADRLVLATHRDFSKELTAQNFDVMTISVPIAWDPQRLCELCDRRSDYFRRGPGAVPSLSPAMASELLDRYGSNIRAIMHELYEIAQRQTSLGNWGDTQQ